MLQRDNQSVKVPNTVFFNHTPLDSQSVCGCTACQHKCTLQQLNYSRLLKMPNFTLFDLPKKDQLTSSRWCRLLYHVTALCYRTFTELHGTSRVTHSASASCSQAVSNTVHWTATNVITAHWKKFCLPAKTSISWKPTKEAAHWTQVIIPSWRQITTASLW